MTIMTNEITAGRTTRIEVELLSRSGAIIGRLEGVSGGEIEYTNNRTVKASGSIDVLDRGQDVDWLNVRLRPIMHINDYAWYLGVFLASTPTETWTSEGRKWTVELLDKSSILDQDGVASSYSLPKNTNVIDAVRTLIQSTGEQVTAAITDSDKTLKNGLMWEPGTSKLRIINDLLDAAGYFALWCDGRGQFQAAPYTLPSDRPSRWTFSDAEEPRLYLPDFEREEDIYSIPNRVVAISQATGEDTALVAVAENTNPNSIFSFPSRGRWIVTTETGVEATDQASLDVYAQRRLTELSSVTATYTLEHAPVPLELNWVTTFTRTPADINNRKATVQNMKIPLSATELMETTFREVLEIT